MSGQYACPGVLRVKDIQSILQIGQVAAYRLIHSGAFPVIRVGRSYRVPQEEFYRWMNTNHGSVYYALPHDISALLSAEQSTTAVVDNSCILAKIKNGGLNDGR